MRALQWEFLLLMRGLDPGDLDTFYENLVKIIGKAFRSTLSYGYKVITISGDSLDSAAFCAEVAAACKRL